MFEGGVVQGMMVLRLLIRPTPIYSFQRGQVNLPTNDHVKRRVPLEALLEASQDRVRVIALT